MIIRSCKSYCTTLGGFWGLQHPVPHKSMHWFVLRNSSGQVLNIKQISRQTVRSLRFCTFWSRAQYYRAQGRDNKMGVVLIKGAWPNIFAHILHVDVLVHYFMKMKGMVVQKKNTQTRVVLENDIATRCTRHLFQCNIVSYMKNCRDFPCIYIIF